MPALQRDDFDMTKLQKSLTQQRQRSRRTRNSVTKLTPAEIRSLNNGIAVAKSLERSLPAQSNSSSSNTPPLTPDHVVPPKRSTSGQSGANLPTPPRSPDNVASQKQHLNSTNAIHIHSPVPLSHHKAGFVVTSHHPRPQSASSHKSLPTYRGNEVTRTGSLSMHRPSVMTHQIVDNPLSQFSRPRQSRGSGSASPTRADPRQQTPTGRSESNSQRSQSIHTVNEPPARPDSPPRPQEPMETPAQKLVNEPDSAHLTEPDNLRLTRSQTAPVDGPILPKNPSRFSWNPRRRHTTQENEGDDVAAAETKQARRRSLTWKRSSVGSMQSVSYDRTKTGNAPELRQSLKGNLPSDRTSIYQEIKRELPTGTDVFATHPAVRPLASEDHDTPTPRNNGKEREQEPVTHDLSADDSIPLYSRCACCGKLKKPAGSRSLSPVLENENIITNFSLEIEKSDHQAQRRRSNSAIRQKYTPIIPMVMAEGKTVQARIGPMQQETLPEQARDAPVMNGRGDIIARGSEPVPTLAMRVDERERKMVRFSSLRLGKELERQMNDDQKVQVNQSNGMNDDDNDDDDDDDAAISAILRQTRDSTHIPNHSANLQTSPPGLEQAGPPIGLSPATNMVVPEVRIDEASGDLITALSGLDVMFDSTTQGGEDQNDVDGPKSKQVIAPPVLSGQLQTGLTSRMSIHELVTSSGSGRPSSELEGRPDLTQQVTTTVTTPKSILKQTKYNSSGRSSFDSSSSPVSSNSSRASSSNGGFTTRPKATARYMLGSSPEPRVSVPPLPKMTSKIPSKEKTVTIAETVERVKSNSEPTPKVMSKEAKSTTFHPLPIPQLGPHFNSSTSTLKNYSLPSRSQSNLVQSVLAATNREPQNDFERALSRF